MPNETIEMFAKYGGYIGLLMGVLILSMSTAIAFLWRHNATLQLRLLEVQNKRVDEAKEVRTELMGQSDDTNKALHEMSAAVHALATLVQDRGRIR